MQVNSESINEVALFNKNVTLSVYFCVLFVATQNDEITLKLAPSCKQAFTIVSLIWWNWANCFLSCLASTEVRAGALVLHLQKNDNHLHTMFLPKSKLNYLHVNSELIIQHCWQYVVCLIFIKLMRFEKWLCNLTMKLSRVVLALLANLMQIRKLMKLPYYLNFVIASKSIDYVEL